MKVEKPFKFGVCEKGCEFPTDLICYNNISRDLEKPGTKGFIAGWGSGSNFREVNNLFIFLMIFIIIFACTYSQVSSEASLLFAFRLLCFLGSIVF